MLEQVSLFEDRVSVIPTDEIVIEKAVSKAKQKPKHVEITGNVTFEYVPVIIGSGYENDVATLAS